MKSKFMNYSVKKSDETDNSDRKLIERDWFNTKWTDRYNFKRDWFYKKWVDRHKFSQSK